MERIEFLLEKILDEMRWQRRRWVALDAKMDARDAADDERKNLLDKQVMESIEIQKIGLAVMRGPAPDGDRN
jgi:hypothetical protein